MNRYQPIRKILKVTSFCDSSYKETSYFLKFSQMKLKWKATSSSVSTLSYWHHHCHHLYLCLCLCLCLCFCLSLTSRIEGDILLHQSDLPLTPMHTSTTLHSGQMELLRISKISKLLWINNWRFVLIFFLSANTVWCWKGRWNNSQKPLPTARLPSWHQSGATGRHLCSDCGNCLWGWRRRAEGAEEGQGSQQKECRIGCMQGGPQIHGRCQILLIFFLLAISSWME